MYHGDFSLSSTFDIKFTTRRFSTGAPFTLAGSPVISAYPDNGTTELTAGITLTVDFDGRTGLNNVRVVASGANGYAAGSNYTLVITTGTVDSISVVGEVIGSFSLEARSGLRPTTAGRTLDVSATGEAGVDWANVGSPTTTLALTGTTIATTQAVNLTAIDGQATTGNNATLNLKQLNIVNSAGDALIASSTGSNGHGVNASGNGTGSGLRGTGGATGAGVRAIGGATSGNGVQVTSTLGAALLTVATTGNGLTASGGGTAGYGILAVGAGSGAGIAGGGGATGPGIQGSGGATSGDGLALSATGGHGLSATGTGTDKHGAVLTGGTAGTSDGLKAVAGTGGVPIRGDLTGNVTGNLSGSVASVTAGVDVNSIKTDATAATILQRSVTGITRGTVGSGSTTTSIVTSSLLPAATVTDQFKDGTVLFDMNTTTAALRGQKRAITASTAGGVLTVMALTTAAVSGDSFTIL